MCASHVDEVWIRCNENLKNPARKIKIFAEVMNQCQKEQFNTLHRTRKDPPAIKRDALNDTLEIARMCVNDDNVDLERYFTPAQIDEETGEIKPVESTHHFKKIVTKVRRRQQFLQMLETGNAVELEKYEKESKEPCNVNASWTLAIISTKSVKDLKAELKKHELKVTGRKQEIQLRLIDHYKTCHDLS